MDQVMSKIKTIMKRREAWVASGLLVFITLIYIAFSLPTAGLSGPVKEQLEAIRMEDNATAYSYTSVAFQKATSLDAFVRFINEYSGLRNNDGIKINKREIKNGLGIVKATLISRSGMETPVIYQLVDEKDRWKIESIIITPQGEYETTPTASSATLITTTDAAKKSAASSTESTATADVTAHTYQDPDHNYSLIYPEEWQFNKADNNKITFNGKVGTESSQSTLTIQPLMASAMEALSVQEIADQEEAQLKEKTGSLKVVEDGLLPPRSNKNERYHGKYVVYSYTLNDQPMKQLQVIYFRSPKRAQYLIDFVAPEAQFETDLPAAKAMIASFTIS